MSERDDLLSQPPTCSPPLSTLLISLKIFLRNKLLFLSLFALTTLPLSFLLVSLSHSSLPFKSHVLHLEAVAHLSSTRFEARHVWKDSRAHALSLLKLKVLFFLPSYFLSLLAAVTAVNSTASSCHAARPTLLTAFTAVKLTWKRPFVTTILIYALSLLYAPVPRVLAPLTGSPGSEFLVLVIGSCFEIYLMAVLSLGLVVSIVEERLGWDAIRVGSEIMAGRRLSGWALSGLFVLVSGVISRDLQRMMDGLDSPLESTTSTVMMVATGFKDKVGLIFLYGIVVLWSYIVTTVFYCECRKRHVGRGEDESVTV
ncbi:uncharacterized protein LOC132190981 [Corylus avellana]|uniref:uncharacterized protein LOC132190981 n=1 Tax=Corylus avellana TaxID=13451 RepID=UPI00286BC3D9|nr:uncharacterized protein LOC132190981 [Corylus avellana]